MKVQPKTRPPVPSSKGTLSLGGDLGSDNKFAGGAKNLWGVTDHQSSMELNILSYNIRTLKEDAKLVELEEELFDTGIKWDLLGLAEVRRREERFITLNSGHTLYHTEANNGQQGVGFLINKKLNKSIVEVKQINPRIATLILKVNKKFKINFI